MPVDALQKFKGALGLLALSVARDFRRSVIGPVRAKPSPKFRPSLGFAGATVEDGQRGDSRKQ
ncbi:hypothetical protein OH77DRAFT_1424158 [Trametes cingulata]|nr:hypothetical protein OH77DRAFT_1424158 [Trametes cingulata]